MNRSESNWALEQKWPSSVVKRGTPSFAKLGVPLWSKVQSIQNSLPAVRHDFASIFDTPEGIGGREVEN